MKKIDIIIPAYNAHNTLEMTLNSIAEQTIKDSVRVIIIDDCSPNGNYNSIIDKFDDLDITLLKNDVNSGCGLTRNVGLDYATSEYIVFVDADDMLFDENSLEILLSNIEENKNLNAVYSYFYEIEDGNIKDIHPSNHFIWIFSSIFRRSFIEKHHIRFSDSSSGEDAGFNKKVKLLSNIDSVKFIDDYCYLWTNANKENRINDADFIKYEGRIGYIKNIVETYKFLDGVEKYEELPFDAKKYDYLGNLLSLYFLSNLIDCYGEKKRHLLIEPFKEYYNKFAPIYNKYVTKEDFCITYNSNYYNHFKSEREPFNGISFDKFISELSDDNYGLLSIDDLNSNKPIFSIIIPLFNAENTIERLLDSILLQGFPKFLYELIIVNDNSTDRSIELIEKYKKLINIKIVNTNTNIHCPGNTRKEGLKYANGEWITFIDNDDYFELDAFYNVMNAINENELKCVCFTYIKEYDVQKNEYIDNSYELDIWLHGKFYNKSFLDKYKIDFKQDLKTHEDLYFNNQILVALNKENALSEYRYFDILTYLWVYEPNSLSRKNFSEQNCYIENYFDDFFKSNQPYIYDAKNSNSEFSIIRTLIALLKGYFYYQSSLWKRGNDDNLVRNNYSYLQNFVIEIQNELNISKEQIISFVMSNPQLYIDIKQQCIYNSCIFVEIQSFSELILGI